MFKEGAELFIFFKGDLLISINSGNLAVPFFSDGLISPNQFEYIEEFDNNSYACSILESNSPIDGFEFKNLRENYKNGSEKQFRHASTAFQLVNWRRNDKFCSCCGKKLIRHKIERAMNCQSCNKLYFPRISPCIIVAITKDDTVLLAHNKNFKPGAYSIIAGFMEAGETTEESVKREVLEEVGIEIENINFIESQSWPFPDSLMLGFSAEWKSGKIRPDGVEIIEANWYKEDQLPQIPSKIAIGGKLIHKAFKQIKSKK